LCFGSRKASAHSVPVENEGHGMAAFLQFPGIQQSVQGARQPLAGAFPGLQDHREFTGAFRRLVFFPRAGGQAAHGREYKEQSQRFDGESSVVLRYDRADGRRAGCAPEAAAGREIRGCFSRALFFNIAHPFRADRVSGASKLRAAGAPPMGGRCAFPLCSGLLLHFACKLQRGNPPLLTEGAA
jgi:hypothetical protein